MSTLQLVILCALLTWGTSEGEPPPYSTTHGLFSPPPPEEALYLRQAALQAVYPSPSPTPQALFTSPHTPHHFSLPAPSPHLTEAHYAPLPPGPQLRYTKIPDYPQQQYHQDSEYEFGYEVRNGLQEMGHQEWRRGGVTRGSYSVLLPDGRRQIVHYEADEHGYRPTIHYEPANQYHL